MAKTDERQQEAERGESLVKVAESQGVPRPVAEEIVEEAISEGVAPEKLKEVVEETAKVEQEDRELATGRKDSVTVGVPEAAKGRSLSIRPRPRARHLG